MTLKWSVCFTSLKSEMKYSNWKKRKENLGVVWWEGNRVDHRVFSFQKLAIKGILSSKFLVINIYNWLQFLKIGTWYYKAVHLSIRFQHNILFSCPMGESNINKLPIWVALLCISIRLLYKRIDFTVTFSLVYIIYLTLPPITLSDHPLLFFSQVVSVLMPYIPISKSRFYIWKKICTVYLSDLALFHLIWWPTVLSTFFKVSSLFFLWLNKTPLHIHTTYSLSVHLLMGS